MAEDFITLDNASPALTGTASTIPAVAAPKPMTWQDMLRVILASSGGSGQQSFADLTQGRGSNVNAGIPLYTPPLQALPQVDEQKKQTSEGDIGQYAKVLAALFGGGAGGASFTGASVGTPIT